MQKIQHTMRKVILMKIQSLTVQQKQILTKQHKIFLLVYSSLPQAALMQDGWLSHNGSGNTLLSIAMSTYCIEGNTYHWGDLQPAAFHLL